MKPIKEIFERVGKNFETKLQTKTGWGRNEVKAAYQVAVSETLAEVLQEEYDEHMLNVHENNTML